MSFVYNKNNNHNNNNSHNTTTPQHNHTNHNHTKRPRALLPTSVVFFTIHDNLLIVFLAKNLHHTTTQHTTPHVPPLHHQKNVPATHVSASKHLSISCASTSARHTERHEANTSTPKDKCFCMMRTCPPNKERATAPRTLTIRISRRERYVTEQVIIVIVIVIVIEKRETREETERCEITER